MAFTVEDAVRIARRAHAGQRDKLGKPYIGHPLRVMARMQTDEERMVAVLHDVLEDTPLTAEDLRRAGCPEHVVQAVIALTKLPGEPLESAMARAAAHPLAHAVKQAGIEDNTDPRRLGQLDPATARRLRRKYAESRRLLEAYSR
ncbi:HD domain-containing protein [Carbonactinospora thermoautotrophica]|uniref:HD domain-containing protein n=1 Tax=Carbonactinospora thermoautotrophica TaxID=1469144 RepID=UPI0022718C35|nr:HD domain-containing protein [Carbonactinospora thermoautotrophica]